MCGFIKSCKKLEEVVQRRDEEKRRKRRQKSGKKDRFDLKDVFFRSK